MKALSENWKRNKPEIILTGLFVISVLAFLIYKLHHISAPYFWDESWVYGPALSEMSLRIPSLLPGSIDIDLSRGHPMLFHFLGGIWGNILGISISSLHLFALTISMLSITTVFYIVNELVSRNAAYVSVILLLVQSIFLAQSAMVLPEVLVSLFALNSLFHWSKKRYILSALFASLCLLSKESGAMLMPALGISYLIHSLIINEFSWLKSLKILGLLVLSCVPYIIFLACQNEKFGWIFYPNHLDLQIQDAKDFQTQLKSAIGYLFFAEGRIFLTCLTVSLTAYHNRKSRIFWSWALFCFIHMAAIFLTNWVNWINVYIYLGLAVVSIVFMSSTLKSMYKEKDYFLLLTIVFALIYLLFTAFNFFSARYLMVLVMIYIIWNVKILNVTELKITILLTVLATIPLLIQALKTNPASDTNQSFINYGTAQLALTKYLEEEELYDEQLFAPFLVSEGLNKRNAGYRTNNRAFTKIIWNFNPAESFYFIRSSRIDEKPNKRNFENREILSEKQFKSGKATFEVIHYSAQNPLINQ